MRRGRNMKQVKNGRQNVRGSHLCFDNFARSSVILPFHYQRHMGGRIVEKNSMSLFLMLAKTFSMVGDNHHDGVFIPVVALEVRNVITQCRIGVCDLAVIETIFVLFGIRCGWLIRIVGIIEMHPNEVWPDRMRRQPGLRMLNNLHPTPFYSSPSRLGLRMLRKVVVVIESAIESGRQSFAVENHRAYECSRAISILPQKLGPGGMTGCERNRKIGYAM